MKRNFLKILATFIVILGVFRCSEAFSDEYKIEIPKFVVHHRFQPHKIEVTVDLESAEILDLASLKTQIESFIQNYEDKSAYWEILNKELTLYLFDAFSCHKVKSIFKISPTNTIPYPRTSEVYFYINEAYNFDVVATLPPLLYLSLNPNPYIVEESFRFTLETNENDFESNKTITCSFLYSPDVQPDDYLNFLVLMKELKKINEKIENENDASTAWAIWYEELNALLEKHTMLSEIYIQVINPLYDENEEYSIFADRNLKV
jgi:hypothetical protein